MYNVDIKCSIDHFLRRKTTFFVGVETQRKND